MSDTPRTDALKRTPMFINRPQDPICGEALLHAAQIEAELTSVTAQRDRLAAIIRHLIALMDDDDATNPDGPLWTGTMGYQQALAAVKGAEQSQEKPL